MLDKIFPKPDISIRDNLHWLYIIRNLMILAETLLVFLAIYGLKIDLPEQQLWLIIFSAVAVNIYTWMRLKNNEPITEMEIFFQIFLDVFALASLIYFTGGASNPIIWVFLLPLIITAIMLPQGYAWLMVILTSCTYTILIRFYIPLPAIEPHMPDVNMLNQDLQHYMHTIQDENYFNLHIFGMWFGFVFSAGIVAFFVAELSKTLREQERSLADARENALRDERVVSLGALAASAAHDMGTPLGTMAILTHEIELEYTNPQFDDLHQKMKIMNQQINRCKEALSLLSISAGEMRAESGKPMSLINYIDEVLKQWRIHNSSTKLNLLISPSAIDINAKIIADRTITHSIINILNNAAKVTPVGKGIDFSADWDNDNLQLKIRDFGPGLPKEIIKLAGKQPIANSKQGLGVGLFLTFSTINRLGGEINFTNIEPNGACIEIKLPLLNSETTDDIAGNG